MDWINRNPWFNTCRSWVSAFMLNRMPCTSIKPLLLFMTIIIPYRWLVIINVKSAERSRGTTGEQWTLYWMVEIRFYVVSVLSGHYLTNGSCTGIQSTFIYYHVTLKKPINPIVCCCFVNVSAQCNAGTKNANSPIFECLFNL